MRCKHDVAEIKLKLLVDPNGLFHALFREKHIGKERDGWRIGRNGALSVRPDGIWFSHESGGGGDIIDLITYALATDFRGALAWAQAFTGGKITVTAQRVHEQQPEYLAAKKAHAAKQSAKARAIWMQAHNPIDRGAR